MKLLVVFASLISACYTSCPTFCNCSDSTVLCMEKEIEYIPNFDTLDTMPMIVDLSGNKITYITNTDFWFDNNYFLKELYLNNSEVIEIEDNAFEELDNLQELYLQNNLLNRIGESLIESLDGMLVLDLSSNYFTSGMPVIKSKSLEVLGLANSKITNVPDDALEYLPNLRILLLPQNNIKHIQLDVFKQVANDFLMIKLSYNTWDCGCKNIELFHYLASKGYVDTSEPYQCLDDKGIFVNIYDEIGVNSELKTRCYEGIETRQIENLVDEKNTILIENDIQKPYSLIKLDNESSIEEEEYINEDSEIVIEQAERSFAKSFDNWIGAIVFLCCFFLGCFLGFYVHLLMVRKRIRNLETESRTKLLIA